MYLLLIWARVLWQSSGIRIVFFVLNEIYFMRLMSYIMQFYNMLWHHTRHSTVNKATFYIFCIESEKHISSFTYDHIKLIILPSLTTADSMILTKLSNKSAEINRPCSVTVAGLDKSCIYVIIYDYFFRQKNERKFWTDSVRCIHEWRSIAHAHIVLFGFTPVTQLLKDF